MSIEQRVKKIIADQFGLDIEKVQTEHKLSEYSIDSLDVVDIVMTLEEQFKIQIEDAEYQNADSVIKIIELVNSKNPS